MPEIDVHKFYALTAEQWRKFAMFHVKAADVMLRIANAIDIQDSSEYHEAVGAFAQLATEQKKAPSSPTLLAAEA